MRKAATEDAFGALIARALRDERARRCLPAGFAACVAADAAGSSRVRRTGGGNYFRRVIALAAAGVLVGGAYAAWTAVSSAVVSPSAPAPVRAAPSRLLSSQENTPMNIRTLAAATASAALTAAAVTTDGLYDPVDDFEVAAGNTLEIGDKTGEDAVLSDAVRAKVAFWADGAKNVVTGADGAVVAWLDAREEAVADAAAYAARTDWTYPRAVVHTAGACPGGAPLVKNDVAAFGGKTYLDFGEYNENKWLLLVDADGARNRVPLTGYAGYLGFGATAGFVVGDVDNSDIAAHSASGVGDNGKQYFHKGAGGNGDDAVFSASNGKGRYGETRINGHIVSSTANNDANRHVRNGWETFVQNGPNRPDMFVSTFFNNGNFKASVNASHTDRQGGGKIAEIMLFREMLTQDEAAEVEAYLRQKWAKGSTLGTVTLAEGAMLTVDGAAGTVVADIAGAGDVVKTGTGTLTVERNGRLAAGTLTLDAGAVITHGKRNHAMPLVAQGGKAVAVAASSLTVADGDRADTFAARGNSADRRVALGGAAASVKKVAVSQAQLVLQPPARPSADTATVEDGAFLARGNLIQNGSFEKDSVTAAYKQSIVPSGWTRSPASTTTSSTVGITTTADTTAWLNQANVGQVADGKNALILQVNDSATGQNGIRQTVAVPTSGLYEFSAYIRCRYRGYNDNTVSCWVYVDDVPVLVRRPWRIGYWGWNADQEKNTFVVDGSATELKFKRVATAVALEAGEHTVEIRAVNVNNEKDTANNRYDRALLVDDVRLEPVAEGVFVALADGAFSSCNTWSNTEINSGNGGSFSSSASPFWTFTGNGGYSRYPSTWFCNPTYAETGEDQCLYLQNGGTASQTVTLPKAGRVRITCRYAKRSNRPDTGATRAGGQTFTVSLGGTVVASAVVTDVDFTTLVAEGEAAVGAQTLTLSGGAVSGTDVATVVDDVRIEYVADEPHVVNDTAFAESSTVWAYDGTQAESDAFGLRELCFSGTASAVQTVTIPADGAYLLTFWTRGKPLTETFTDANPEVYGVYHNYQSYAHNIEVRLDGALVGNVYNEAADRHVVEMRLPWLKKGTHVLKFGGSAQTVEAAQSRVSAPVITPLATGTMPDWSDVALALADGATLNLDFDGMVRVSALRVDGESYIGTFDAANASFISGAGAVEVLPRGTVVIIK